MRNFIHFQKELSYEIKTIFKKYDQLMELFTVNFSNGDNGV